MNKSPIKAPKGGDIAHARVRNNHNIPGVLQTRGKGHAGFIRLVSLALTLTPFLVSPTAVAGLGHALRWAAMSGSKERNAGTPQAPSGRMDAVSWVGLHGNLWLFSGYGLSSQGKPTYLNDLWSFNTHTQQWHREASRETAAGGVHKGGNGVLEYPPGRVAAMGWSSGHGGFWLFGGFGKNAGGVPGALQDLWRFDPTRHKWVRIGGSTAADISGRYGKKGLGSRTTWPGARSGGMAWRAKNGNLWLFGGYGLGRDNHAGYLNDLWIYSPTTRTWTWIQGPRHVNGPANYPALGHASANAAPGARSGGTTWIGKHGNLWLFGGYGYAANKSQHGPLNDIWEFVVRRKEWRWWGGSRSANPRLLSRMKTGRSHPGGLGEAASWHLNHSELIIFGFGNDDRGRQGYLDHMWQYLSRQHLWVSLGGRSERAAWCCVNSGRNPGDNSPAPMAGASTWETPRHLFLFGGFGLDANGDIGYLNRLWEAKTPDAQRIRPAPKP